MPTRIGICGAAGRMGRALIHAVDAREDVVLAAAIERVGSTLIGADAGEMAALSPMNVKINASLASQIDLVDVVIDFTAPAATIDNVALCRQEGKGIVIGTTGLNDQQKQFLIEASQEIPIVYSGNYSVGVNVSLKLLELAAKAFGDTVDIDVLEAHHRYKVDAPSGTALMMGEAVAKALGRDLKEVACYAREGHTGPRDRQTIGFQTIRGGDIVGDHTVYFMGDGERVEIRHVATNRMNFANGAVRAAAWIGTRRAGLYDMRDVLGLK
ncbi:4-hydroxy-tetrahydrodipicolinate reductase [Agitococcus lubricus]|uniref:4-hydroxy-tetrahydrodipicolinate reductase n=1 Tax=Agitococcus lubricus TaxID=1077255 RepID=A0A2T5J3H3_9GAMM|nr:4-hydroxy-tetrahydrodipicolinate reductase [Agitococcus lubricus]PTQ91126.1 dihydrodipicolinate reductase [Agitococcus lubricus]